jgi:hypothetical protein
LGFSGMCVLYMFIFLSDQDVPPVEFM